MLVLAVLMVSYASSMRAYFEQRHHMDDVQRDIAESRANIKALQREKARWDDPAYVRAQARQRFGWVLPGEIAYQVIDEDGKPLDHDDSLTNPGGHHADRAPAVVAVGLAQRRGGRQPRGRDRRAAAGHEDQSPQAPQAVTPQ